MILMKDDFSMFKDFPKLDLVAVWKKKMLETWKFKYKEVPIAEAWDKSWGKCRLTRVEANETNPLRGGTPSDNNLVESQNRVDKLFLTINEKLLLFLLTI